MADEIHLLGDLEATPFQLNGNLVLVVNKVLVEKLKINEFNCYFQQVATDDGNILLRVMRSSRASSIHSCRNNACLRIDALVRNSEMEVIVCEKCADIIKYESECPNCHSKATQTVCDLVNGALTITDTICWKCHHCTPIGQFMMSNGNKSSNALTRFLSTKKGKNRD